MSDTLSAALFVAFVLLVYFAPTVSAVSRRHPNAEAIFLVNVLLGWTFIGWVVALVWSATYRAPGRSWP